MINKNSTAVLILFFLSLNVFGQEESLFIDANKVEQKCLSGGWNKTKFETLKNNNFAIQNQDTQQALALQLLSCLAHPDPVIRDEIAFSALSRWLRADSFNSTVYLTMFDKLINVLTNHVNDKHAVYKPFAALVLSEVVRVDRKSPYLNDAQRSQVVNIISNYFIAIDDFRGFDEKVGWRHNIAHSADVMLQLALNSKTDKQQLDQLLTALASQINADGQHFYIYGEPKRIAMPVIYIFLRKLHSLAEWEVWLEGITSAPLTSWGDAYKSQKGLAKLHNTQNFLNAFYILIHKSENPTLVSMIPALEKAIKTVN